MWLHNYTQINSNYEYLLLPVFHLGAYWLINAQHAEKDRHKQRER